MCNKIKAGIIGFGYMGNYHYRKSISVGSFDIKAVYDNSKEALENGKKEGFVTYENIEEFLKDEEISLVFICTPNDTHAYYSKLCLNAGKNVMVEKPVTMNEDELKDVIKCANKNAKIFTVHQNRRWNEDFKSVEQVVKSNKIGNITNIESKVFGQKGVCYGWRAEPEKGGGMLYDWGIHLVDQALQLFKDEKVVRVYSRLQSVLSPSVDDNDELHITFESGTCFKIYVATFALQHQPRWLVFGDKGTMVLNDFDSTNGDIKVIKGDVSGFDSVFGKAVIGPSRTMAPLQPENIENVPLPEIKTDDNEYHRNLIESVKGNEKVYVSHKDMLRSMQIIMTAFESSNKNIVIETNI
ncbi:MAG: Gfo/Idh/MocA family oxidoreductase [Clostridia bacterium]